MAAYDQKLRILYLMDIMLERTDEEHLLNASELMQILEDEYSITCNRKTLYSDLEILSVYGLDIQQKKGTNPGYFIGARDFELPELKLLVDAVQSSRFITEAKSWELIHKLEKLCCKSDADILSQQIFIINRPKTENETIYYNVDAIHTAIHKNCEISFQYAEWTPQKKLHLRKDGARYTVSPWALTWDSDNYYLVAFDHLTDKIKHYRVDKMQRIRISGSRRKGEKTFRGFNLSAYAKKTFGMFGGRDEEVTLRCKDGLAGVIIDRFGQNVWITPRNDGTFLAHITASISPQFFGWVTAIGAGMHIEGPKNVVEEYKEYLKNILGIYE